MEVHFTREAEKKLNDLAAQSGRGADKELKGALAGYFEEVTQTRDMLKSRYDDLKSGTAKLIDGEEVFWPPDGKNRSAAQPSGMSGHALHPEAYDDLDDITVTSAGQPAPPRV